MPTYVVEFRTKNTSDKAVSGSVRLNAADIAGAIEAAEYALLYPITITEVREA